MEEVSASAYNIIESNDIQVIDTLLSKFYKDIIFLNSFYKNFLEKSKVGYANKLTILQEKFLKISDKIYFFDGISKEDIVRMTTTNVKFKRHPKGDTILSYKEGTTVISFEINDNQCNEIFSYPFVLLHKNIALDLTRKIELTNQKK